MPRYSLIPERSRVRIEGSSSVHAIHAETLGLIGELDLERTATGIKRGSHPVGWVEVEVGKLRASNPLVEAETKRRIDAKQFPTIRGELTSTTVTSGSEVNATGTITFRGIERPVEGALVVESDGDLLKITGTQTFDVREWNLQPPKVLLLKVSPMITVTFEAFATLEA